VKLIQTPSLIKLMSDLKTQPGVFPNENNDGQGGLFYQDPADDPQSIIKRWNRKQRVPKQRIYQLGIDVPSVIKNKPGML